MKLVHSEFAKSVIAKDILQLSSIDRLTNQAERATPAGPKIRLKPFVRLLHCWST